MRIVSLVPSWTETLLHCGVDVVGRTRFCVHPKELIKGIPVVGGTKDWKWDKIAALKPDLILLDREENPKFMADQTEFAWHATHVTDIADMPSTLQKLASITGEENLNRLSRRWEAVAAASALEADFDALPGVIEWVLKPVDRPKRVLYMIWKDPWICVSRDTFIGSVLRKVGISIPEFPKKYPEIDLSLFDAKETLLLFSTEPYPFFKRKRELEGIRFPHAFVQGECFSWFGVRSLEFLERSRFGGRRI